VVHCVQRTVDAEALVHFERCRYSVPISFVGQRVALDARPGSVLIRSKDCILAEHPRARTAGTRVENPEHVRERWQRSTAPPPPPPRKGCIVTFGDAVEHRPLSLYQEIAS
jgi:hypothetical protein